MHWIIQNNLFHETGIENLTALLTRISIPYSIHKVIPFIGEIEPDIEIDGPVMVIGSYSLRHVAKRKGWVPGVFDLETADYQECVRHWGEHMLNHEAAFCRFRDSPSFAEGLDECFFMRPVADSKFFAGAITDRIELTEWVERVVKLDGEGACDANNLNPDTLVMMANPKTIFAEYRLWIVDGRAVTASLYKRGGRVMYDGNVEPEVFAYANARAAEWEPTRAYVMDVARTDDGLRIIENNTLNAAGLYLANVGKLVEAIENMKFD